MVIGDPKHTKEPQMPIPSKILPDILSQELLGHPYDSSSTHPERFEIDFLTEQLEDWEQGGNSTENLLATFEAHNTGTFDITGFIQSHVDQGTYRWPKKHT
jgi:hypothetical protein